ncbi:MAG: hypothetical protein AAF125_18230 [Chloroflexota bacterium]
MTDTAYDLHLVLMECLEGQEFDGDEPYLKINGEKVWSWDVMGRKMQDSLASKGWTNAFDFRTGRFRTLEGWEQSEAYSEGHFSYTNLTGETKIELWEQDDHEVMRGDDDFLGEITLTIDNARLGNQIVVFDQNNALYQLTFRLVAHQG